MRNRSLPAWLIIILMVMSVALHGCAFVSVSLLKTRGPLEETVVAGKGKDKILLIELEGVISDEKKRGFIGFEEESFVSHLKEELTKAGEDERVKAVVLKINTPGGTVTASDIIYQELKRFKEKKGIKTVACLMDLATSGGYMAAVACDKIVAHPTSVTGSIGVIALKINASGLLEKIGVENETMKAGEKKDLVSPLRGMTPEEKAIIQEVLDELHQQFMERIAESRKELNLEQIKALSDGRIFTAHQALEHKLIDRVGYLEDALDLAKTEANLKEAKVVVYHRPYGYRSNIYSQLPSAPLPTINLVNLELGSLLKGGGMNFMYLWMP
jgi:protease-4